MLNVLTPSLPHRSSSVLVVAELEIGDEDRERLPVEAVGEHDRVRHEHEGHRPQQRRRQDPEMGKTAAGGQLHRTASAGKTVTLAGSTQIVAAADRKSTRLNSSH